MRFKYLSAASVGAVFALAQLAHAAPLTYDCQARMTRVETVPPVAAGDSDPWQCPLPTAKQSSATHWLRNSLEYCRLTVSVYDEALRAARHMAATHRRHQWIVLMDADETVLDNSLFDREGDICTKRYTDAEWESWVHADMARDVPGAAAFTQAVHRMGGLIGIVTNRIVADDDITQHALTTNGIWFDDEIGLSETKSDKLARWRGVVTRLSQKFGGHPRAVMWIGDQITDLAVVDRKGLMVRAMTQQDSGNGIGAYLFVLPDPMYGNWTANPSN